MGEVCDGDRTEQDGALNNRSGSIDAFDSFAEKLVKDETYNRSAAVILLMMRTTEGEVQEVGCSIM